VQLLPPLSWVAVIVIAVLLGARVGDRAWPILVGLCFLYLAVFGQWRSAMVTLASILIAVPLRRRGGLLLGIAGLSLARASSGRSAGARPDADRAGLRLSGADPVPVRLRAGLGDHRHHHLRHAADGAGSPSSRCPRVPAKIRDLGP
jgi:hypothetical protein